MPYVQAPRLAVPKVTAARALIPRPAKSDIHLNLGMICMALRVVESSRILNMKNLKTYCSRARTAEEQQRLVAAIPITSTSFTPCKPMSVGDCLWSMPHRKCEITLLKGLDPPELRWALKSPLQYFALR